MFRLTTTKLTTKDMESHVYTQGIRIICINLHSFVLMDTVRSILVVSADAKGSSLDSEEVESNRSLKQ